MSGVCKLNLRTSQNSYILRCTAGSDRGHFGNSMLHSIVAQRRAASAHLSDVFTVDEAASIIAALANNKVDDPDGLVAESFKYAVTDLADHDAKDGDGASQHILAVLISALCNLTINAGVFLCS